MDAKERAYVQVLASTARATVYALERELSFTGSKRRRRQLAEALEGARADLARCELVLG